MTGFAFPKIIFDKAALAWGLLESGQFPVANAACLKVQNLANCGK